MTAPAFIGDSLLICLLVSMLQVQAFNLKQYMGTSSTAVGYGTTASGVFRMSYQIASGGSSIAMGLNSSKWGCFNCFGCRIIQLVNSGSVNSYGPTNNSKLFQLLWVSYCNTGSTATKQLQKTIPLDTNKTDETPNPDRHFLKKHCFCDW